MTLREAPCESDEMPLKVLLIEDNPGDARLMQEAVRAVPELVDLHIACDGVEAMAFLRRRGGYDDAPRPDFILLDLNLPRMDGREVLACIKADEDLKTIPTIILTTSDAEADVVNSYQLQANCYLTKPVQFEEFENLVKSINDFWMIKAKLPPATKARPPDAGTHLRAITGRQERRTSENQGRRSADLPAGNKALP